MRVAVFNGADRPITIENVPEPQPGAGDLLVKVGRCGICGSDVSMTSPGPFMYPVGCHLGHEYAGEVVEIGKDVSDVRIGDAVACVPCTGCGECAECRDGNYFYCEYRAPLFGGFGEYVSAPRRNAVVLPRSLSLSDGALVEPIACGLHALEMAAMKKGDRILVLGAGSTASAVIFWARKLDAGRIVAVTRSGRQRDSILEIGADALLSLDDKDRVAEALGGPPDIVAECVGKPGMIEMAIDLVRPGGTIVSLGMCVQSENINSAICSFKELKLLFPRGYKLKDFVATANAFDEGSIDPSAIVGNIIPLEELDATLVRMRAGETTLKVQVYPQLEPTHD